MNVRRYCGSTPACFTMPCQRAYSAFTKAAKSAWLIGITSSPAVAMRFLRGFVLEQALHHRVHALDHRRGRAGGRDDADPHAHEVAGQPRLGRGRQAPADRAAAPSSRSAAAGFSRHRAPARNVPDRARDQLDAAGEQVGHRRRVAAVGHVRHLDAGQARELGRRQMRQRARPGRAVGETFRASPWQASGIRGRSWPERRR